MQQGSCNLPNKSRDEKWTWGKRERVSKRRRGVGESKEERLWMGVTEVKEKEKKENERRGRVDKNK